jgi:tetraacyldisaccharide 4'-kinase
MNRPLLLPLVPLYAAGLALREMRLGHGWEPVRRLRHPVISIGNLSTGGSGKTPLAIALSRLLSARGFEVDVLSRGYRRTSREPARVRSDGTAEQYGDEPLLIARESGVRVYVAPERYDAGNLAEKDLQSRHEGVANVSGHDFSRPAREQEKGGALAPEHPSPVHILDDGFQHRQLYRDIDILLVSRADWHDHLLPAGNLREGLRAARRADVLVIPAEDSDFQAQLRSWGWAGPIWLVRRRMEIPQITVPVVAFCGIARPEQFFSGLKSAGISLASQIAFADHHPYSKRDIERLAASARNAGARAFLTTRKDQVRLGDFVATLPTSLPLETANLSVAFEEEQNALTWLEDKLSSAHLAQGHCRAL